MASTTSPAPVLDLTTVAPQVRIDGELYPLRVREDYSILRNAELMKKMLRADELRAKPTLTSRETKEHVALLEEICRVVLDAPADVHARLTELQRLQVANCFFSQVMEARPGGAAPATPRRRPTSVKSPRA